MTPSASFSGSLIIDAKVLEQLKDTFTEFLPKFQVRHSTRQSYITKKDCNDTTGGKANKNTRKVLQVMKAKQDLYYS